MPANLFKGPPHFTIWNYPLFPTELPEDSVEPCEVDGRLNEHARQNLDRDLERISVNYAQDVSVVDIRRCKGSDGKD